MERFKLERNRTSLCNLETGGGKIRHARLQRNLTHKELGILTGLNKQTIADCENDKFPKSIDTIDLICEALNLVPSNIYDDYLKFISEDIPAQVKSIREGLGLNRYQFVNLIGTDAVYNWETGKKKPSRKFYEILKKYIKKE